MPSLTTHYNDIHMRRRRDIAERKQLQQSIRGSSPTPSEGVMGKVRQMNSYNPEAVCGELIADLFILVFQLLFNVPYLRDKIIYNEQLKKELFSKLQGRPLRLVFEPDEYDRLPELYPVAENGEVQVDAPPITNQAQMTEELIRANGYTPRPNFFNGYKMAMDMHIEAMLGSGILSNLDKMRLHGTTGQENSSNNKDPDPKVWQQRTIARPAR